MDNNEKEYLVIRERNLFVDSRDCIGITSLKDSQNYCQTIGLRPFSSGKILNLTDNSPVIVTIDKTVQEARLKENDKVTIKCNFRPSNDLRKINFDEKTFVIKNLNGNQFELANSFPFGNYSDGLWERQADESYPNLQDFKNIIDQNEMKIEFEYKLRDVKSITLINTMIPRDIIPLEVYLGDFTNVSSTRIGYLTQITPNQPINNYLSYVPQYSEYLVTQTIGIFSTPLELFRTYINGAYNLPSQITPFPLVLWNTPVGNQPVPYPYQTVPTYCSGNILINGEITRLVLSGYGVYDFNDFAIELIVNGIDIGRMITEIARKMLLLCICQIQSCKSKDSSGNFTNNVYDYIDMIFHSSCTSNDVFPYGYGVYQRFVPGPGLQMNYQPASTGGDPTIASVDSPVPFPNFRGNVWGPYDTPGDRFQKLGVLQTVQDLFLNGDLKNLYGDPIIKEDVIDLMSDSTFGINFNSIRQVDLENFVLSTNVNICNAMRIRPNGFGTVNLRIQNDKTYLKRSYFNGGGMGPDALGTGSSGGAWVNNGIYQVAGSGIGSFNDPIGAGPDSGFSTTLMNEPTPSDVDASISGAEISPTTPMISNRNSWYVGESKFIDSLVKWRTYLYNEVRETNLVIDMKNQDQDISPLGSNTNTYRSIFSCPIRLNLSSDSGTIKYVETLQGLLTNSNMFWEKKFGNTISSIDSIILCFKTYEGVPIPLEKMLQERRSVDFLRIFERIVSDDNNILNFPKYFLYNPRNPLLNGRVKKNIALIFKIENLENANIGIKHLTR